LFLTSVFHTSTYREICVIFCKRWIIPTNRCADQLNVMCTSASILIVYLARLAATSCLYKQRNSFKRLPILALELEASLLALLPEFKTFYEVLLIYDQ
jgi:hypothetical protein